MCDKLSFITENSLSLCMRLANLAYYSKEFAFLNLKLKLFRLHTGSAGSFFTLKQYNKKAPVLTDKTDALVIGLSYYASVLML